jgi:serine/threonine protein kinase
MEVYIKKHDMSFSEFLKMYHDKDNVQNIGAGGSGMVYKVTPILNDPFKYPSIKRIASPIAMKVLLLPNEIYSNAKIPKVLHREYYIYKLLEIHEKRYTSKHGSINGTSYFGKIYDVIKLQNAYIVYMEYIKGSPLSKFFQNIYDARKNKRCGNVLKKMDHSFYIPLFMRLIEGIAIIHDAGIVHLDIAFRNIMFDGGNIKYIDFGESCLTFNDEDNLLKAGAFERFKCQNEKKLTPEFYVYGKNEQQSLRNLDMRDLGMIMLDFLSQTRDYDINELFIDDIDFYMGQWYMNFINHGTIPLSPESLKILNKSKKKGYNELNDKDKVDVLYEEFYYRSTQFFDFIDDDELRLIVMEVCCGGRSEPSIILKRLRDIKTKNI